MTSAAPALAPHLAMEAARRPHAARRLGMNVPQPAVQRFDVPRGALSRPYLARSRQIPPS
eukprot:31160-Pelagococcus_subviridis.AAC.9